MVLYFMLLWNSTPAMMYLLCSLLGFAGGFWAIFVTIGAEQFGTNLRATAATTIPNMVRGTVPFVIALFQFLRELPGMDYIQGAIYTCVIIMVICSLAVLTSKETFHKDLNYEEE